MGTDIHLFVEARKSAGEPWELVSVKSQCSWCDGKRVNGDGNTCGGCDGMGEEPGFRCRNYNTFAIIANVRNGRGFAGCDTGDGFASIAMPRGLPDDVSNGLRNVIADSERDEFDDGRWRILNATYGATYLGDHDHSYLSLNELVSFNWNQRTNLRGAVGPIGFTAFEENGAPNSWSDGLSGHGVAEVSNSGMRYLVQHAEFSSDPHFWRVLGPKPGSTIDANLIGKTVFTRIQWSVSYKETSKQFYEHFLPALCKFAQRNNVSKDDVRIVFGFDS